jgi:hypothetical protein
VELDWRNNVLARRAALAGMVRDTTLAFGILLTIPGWQRAPNEEQAAAAGLPGSPFTSGPRSMDSHSSTGPPPGLRVSGSARSTRLHHPGVENTSWQDGTISPGRKADGTVMEVGSGPRHPTASATWWHWATVSMTADPCPPSTTPFSQAHWI